MKTVIVMAIYLIKERFWGKLKNSKKVIWM